MLNFVLCDDSHTAIEKLSIMLDSIFIKNNLDGQIVFSTSNPYNLLKYVETTKEWMKLGENYNGKII